METHVSVSASLQQVVPVLLVRLLLKYSGSASYIGVCQVIQSQAGYERACQMCVVFAQS